MLEVVSARHVADYTIEVWFNNGNGGIVDLQETLWGPVFEPLKDMARFRQFEVSPILHTIRWDNDADLAPEFLQDKLLEQSGGVLARLAQDALEEHRAGLTQDLISEQ